MKRSLIFCGDIHGELKKLVYELKRLEIKNSNVVILGDFGVGFGGPNAIDVRYSEVEKILNTNDIIIYTIRGNHDNPDYFDGQHDFERLKYIVDHQILKLSDKLIYPIGGATSVDIDFKDLRTRKSRRDYNNEYIRRGSRKRCWWPNEIIKEEYDNLPESVDIIISHTAPLSFPPVLDLNIEELREETKEKIKRERKYLDFILKTIKTERWFYGHFHKSQIGSFENVLYRCLGIDELFELL